MRRAKASTWRWRSMPRSMRGANWSVFGIGRSANDRWVKIEDLGLCPPRCGGAADDHRQLPRRARERSSPGIGSAAKADRQRQAGAAGTLKTAARRQPGGCRGAALGRAGASQGRPCGDPGFPLAALVPWRTSPIAWQGALSFFPSSQRRQDDEAREAGCRRANLSLTCGIAGLYYPGQHKPVDPARIADDRG